MHYALNYAFSIFHSPLILRKVTTICRNKKTSLPKPPNYSLKDATLAISVCAFGNIQQNKAHVYYFRILIGHNSKKCATFAVDNN